ncbi:MAG: hypothetical protein ABI862_03030 [Ilumatobacteraceae bacterium]
MLATEESGDLVDREFQAMLGFGQRTGGHQATAGRKYRSLHQPERPLVEERSVVISHVHATPSVIEHTVER